MQQIQLDSAFRRGYSSLMKYISNISHLDKKVQSAIYRRLDILEFFDEFGLKATIKAFKTQRSTLYLWRQKLRESGGQLLSLTPGSKAPKIRSKRKLTADSIKFIKDYRISHPGVDQVTIKPHLDAFCRVNGLPTVCEATIATVIRELKEKGELPSYYIKTTINGRTGNLKYRRVGQAKKRKLRLGNYTPRDPGDLVQIDAITFFIYGVRRHIITAIDVKTKFAFALAYKTLSSSTARDFLQKLEKVAPFTIRAVQTDNGSEFMKHFDTYLAAEGITHFWNYPRYPKANAYIENFNGLIQRQYVGWHLDDLLNPDDFNKGLVRYLLWYNGEKPHRSICKLPPLLYYVNNFINPEKSNMLLDGAVSLLFFNFC